MSDESRIGRGLLNPLVREHGDFANATGPTLLRSCVAQVVNTDAAGFEGRMGGTYPWRLNFGSHLRLLRHSNFFDPSSKGAIGSVYVAEAVERWEPRVDVSTEGVTAAQDSAVPNSLNLRIYFAVAEDLGGDVRLENSESSRIEVTL